MKRLIITADDFGLSESVNEAVEQAHRDGILTAASLMVTGPAAADAVRRAKTMPTLAVGLHLVVIEGPAVLGGEFPSDQLGLGMRYFFSPKARRQLAAEIEAQFAAFAATGLKLDHANAHKHMHLHPTVGRLLMDIGRRHGLRAVRVPAEPVALTPPPTPSPKGKGDCKRYPPSPWGRGLGGGVADRALLAWTRVLRWQARKAGLFTNDHCFGLRWSGAMTAERVRGLIGSLPGGLSEIYLHPATRGDERLTALMPAYQHEAELAALLDPGVREALAASGVVLEPGFYAAIRAASGTGRNG